MIRAGLGLLVVGSFVFALTQLPIESYTVAILEWIDSLGMVGYAVFVATYILFTVLFIPGFILTVGGGAVFGLMAGFALVSVGSTLGACLAFLIGRFLARDAVEAKVSNNPRFGAIDAAVGRQGWKIVALTRLTPIFPFNLINYAYGLTRIPFWHYGLASWIGMMPGTLVYVYIGSLAGDAARAAVDETHETTTLEMAMQGVGLVATIVVTIYITRLARRALKDEIPEADSPGDDALVRPAGDKSTGP